MAFHDDYPPLELVTGKRYPMLMMSSGIVLLAMGFISIFPVVITAPITTEAYPIATTALGLLFMIFAMLGGFSLTVGVRQYNQPARLRVDATGITLIPGWGDDESHWRWADIAECTVTTHLRWFRPRRTVLMFAADYPNTTVQQWTQARTGYHTIVDRFGPYEGYDVAELAQLLSEYQNYYSRV